MSLIVAPTATRNLLKVLAEPVRFQMLQSLSNGEKCVCDLIQEIGLAQSKISFHLKVLKEAGLISDKQCRRWVDYKLEIRAFEDLKPWVDALTKDCQKACSS